MSRFKRFHPYIPPPRPPVTPGGRSLVAVAGMVALIGLLAGAFYVQGAPATGSATQAGHKAGHKAAQGASKTSAPAAVRAQVPSIALLPAVTLQEGNDPLGFPAGWD